MTKPKHTIRTTVLSYRFGSMKAAETAKQKRGTQRQPAKLPTSLKELPDKVKAKPITDRVCLACGRHWGNRFFVCSQCDGWHDKKVT